MERTDVEKMLPNVGDILHKKPFSNPERMKCTVTYVNRKGLWYEVRFDTDTGSFKECYKLPKWNYHPISGYVHKNELMLKRQRHPENSKAPKKVKIVETREIFDTLGKCARRLGCTSGAISHALKTNAKIGRKYHVVLAD